jgi:hypothetical protein
MKQAMVAVSKALIRGLLIVVPVYLAILLLLKGMKAVANLVRPFTALLPDWIPAEDLLSLLLVLAICAVIGATVGTRIGRGARDWLERSVFERIPGYGVIRSLTRQMAGKSSESTWRAALVEIEDNGDRSQQTRRVVDQEQEVGDACDPENPGDQRDQLAHRCFLPVGHSDGEHQRATLSARG